MILRKKEAAVLECIRQKKSAKETAIITGIPAVTVVTVVARLSELGAIERVSQGVYRIVATQYEVTDDFNAGHYRGAENERLDIPPDVERYIRLHYHSKPRREIAKYLQLDKFTLNTMILQMGISR